MGVARVAQYTLTYYAVTTALSVLLGILMVVVVKPGRGEPLEGSSTQGCSGHQVDILTGLSVSNLVLFQAYITAADNGKQHNSSYVCTRLARLIHITAGKSYHILPLCSGFLLISTCIAFVWLPGSCESLASC